MQKQQYKTVEEYIGMFPPDVRKILQKVRQAIKRVAPGAGETISYQMPAYKLNGVLVYFAAYKNHIGFYPTASGIDAFKKELSPYKSSKGAVQFPLGKPIPYDLIERIVIYRVEEDRKKDIKK